MICHSYGQDFENGKGAVDMIRIEDAGCELTPARVNRIILILFLLNSQGY